MIQELGSQLVPVLAIVCTFSFLIVWLVAATMDSIYKTFCNSRLKERLVEKGLSAYEIDQIIRAGSTLTEESTSEPRVAPVPPIKSGQRFPMSKSAF
jgi:hypothetical protein